MPLNDRSYYPGDDETPPEDRPRCMAKPTKADLAANPPMRRDLWECSLWTGHGKHPAPRYHAHQWVCTQEVY